MKFRMVILSYNGWLLVTWCENEEQKWCLHLFDGRGQGINIICKLERHCLTSSFHVYDTEWHTSTGEIGEIGGWHFSRFPKIIGYLVTRTGLTTSRLEKRQIVPKLIPRRRTNCAMEESHISCSYGLWRCCAPSTSSWRSSAFVQCKVAY